MQKKEQDKNPNKNKLEELELELLQVEQQLSTLQSIRTKLALERAVERAKRKELKIKKAKLEENSWVTLKGLTAELNAFLGKLPAPAGPDGEAHMASLLKIMEVLYSSIRARDACYEDLLALMKD